MTAIFNGKMKYLLLAPIVVLVIFASLNQSALTKLNGELLNEKKSTVQAEIDQLVNITGNLNEFDRNLSKDGYVNILISQIASINSKENVFAVLYDQNLKLISYNNSGSDGIFFDPTQFPKFNDDVTGNQYGWIELSYTNPDSQTIPIYVYYRWAPIDPYGAEHYLLTAGVSEESLTIKPAAWLMTDMIAQLAVTFLMNLAFVLLLCYLGEIYKSRRGFKWRQG